jgi:hypothetical protein
MKSIIKSVIGGFVLASATAYGGNGTTAEHIEAAKVAYKKVAADTSYQWTVSVKAIKAAEKALKAGNDAEAREHAHQAMGLVEATALQAKIETDTWHMRVPK